MRLQILLTKCGAALAAMALPALLFFSPGWAARELSTDTNHKGIVAFEPYQVFPENRPGNAIYLNNRLLLSVPEHTIIGVKALAAEGRFAYLVRKPFGGRDLGIQLLPTEPPPRITQLSKDFFHVVVVIEGVVYKKVFRLARNTIIDLLPNSKTADGMTVGASGLLFFHVSSMTREEQDGKTVSLFGMRLHLALFNEERLRNLDYPITNTLPSLLLAWNGDTDIEVRLADGRVEVLSISQFQ